MLLLLLLLWLLGRWDLPLRCAWLRLLLRLRLHLRLGDLPHWLLLLLRQLLLLSINYCLLHLRLLHLRLLHLLLPGPTELLRLLLLLLHSTAAWRGIVCGRVGPEVLHHARHDLAQVFRWVPRIQLWRADHALGDGVQPRVRRGTLHHADDGGLPVLGKALREEPARRAKVK